MVKHSVQKCLEAVGVLPGDLESSKTLDREFKVVKKAYFRKVLTAHPDKGGDPEDFRKLQGSFEVLQALYQSKRIKTFLVPEVFDDDGDNDPFEGFDFDEDFDHESGDAQTQTPSWAYYKEAAASEDEPGYRVEPAKSGRGKCHQTTKGAKMCEDGSKIPKGAVRIGSLDQMSGAYARWVRLGCWWVPSRVWLGLDGLFQPLFVPPTTKRGKGHYVSSPTRPRGDNDDDVGSGDGDGENNESESSTTATITVVQVRRDFDPDEIRIALRALERMEDVVLSGFAALSDDQKLDFVKHVLDHEHHARLNKNHLRDLETIEAEATPKAVEENGKVRAELEPLAAAAATASALSVPVTALSAALPSPNESANASQALAKTKQEFLVPRPGIDGIQGALESKRFVLTGIYNVWVPEDSLRRRSPRKRGRSPSKAPSLTVCALMQIPKNMKFRGSELVDADSLYPKRMCSKCRYKTRTYYRCAPGTHLCKDCFRTPAKQTLKSDNEDRNIKLQASSKG